MSVYGSKWTHDEAVLALGLYFQMPFEKISSRAPEVISLANLMGRSPASLSMKMDNFGRFDPTLSVRGIAGLRNGAKLDKLVWDEFPSNREDLANKYQELLAQIHGDANVIDDETIKTPPGLEGVRLTKYRINQSFFRRSVLSAYGNRCCITRLSEPRLLIASHIKPWAKCLDGNERTDATNGLCLNALHDRAFDKGMITIDERLRIVVSPGVRDMVPRDVAKEYFLRYEGCPILIPVRGRPREDFLTYHRENVFVA